MNSRLQIPVQSTGVPTSGILRRKCACGGSGGQCAECAKKTLQRRAAGDGTHMAPPIVHDVLRSPGQPLDARTRAYFEPRFGHDFSRVRVHSDSEAGKSAQSINALAYTVGQHVVFAGGRYAAGSAETKALLAHELAHTLQQRHNSPASSSALQVGPKDSAAEREAGNAEHIVASSGHAGQLPPSSPSSLPGAIHRKVDPANVSCRTTGLINPNLTGDQAVAALQAADADAIELALRAQELLDFHLLNTRGGLPVEPGFDAILHQELGLTLTNPAHFPLIQQQADRFGHVHDLLASGFLRYICRGGTVSLVGCDPPGACGPNFAFSCPANRLIVLCQAFWDNADQQSATLLHEPFHVLFTMERHANNALRRADSSCFESFALRVAGRAAFASCVGHTNG